MSAWNTNEQLTQYKNPLLLQDRELQDLRKIINNLKEKTDIGDQFQHQGKIIFSKSNIHSCQGSIHI